VAVPTENKPGELVEHAKREPGKLHYSSPGNGGPQHLAMDPSVRAVLQKQGMTAAGGPPQRLAELVARELPRWARVEQAAGIRAD